MSYRSKRKCISVAEHLIWSAKFVCRIRDAILINIADATQRYVECRKLELNQPLAAAPAAREEANVACKYSVARIYYICSKPPEVYRSQLRSL